MNLEGLPVPKLKNIEWINQSQEAQGIHELKLNVIYKNANINILKKFKYI